MKCKHCGKEIPRININMFQHDGTDKLEPHEVFQSMWAKDCAVVVTSRNWTGYDLDTEERLETIECPHCGKFPFSETDFEVMDGDGYVNILMREDVDTIFSGENPTSLNLPYGVGDTVYFIYDGCLAVEGGKIVRITIDKYATSIQIDHGYKNPICFDIEFLNEKWFLKESVAREKAEEIRKERSEREQKV